MFHRTVISLAASCVLFAGALTAGPAAAAEAQNSGTALESVAHRGDKEHHPDNTLAGVESAIAKGADWVEIDVHYNIAGDKFYLSHDNLCKGPGGTALIDSGSPKRIEKNCQLPTLDDVFAAFGKQTATNFVYEFKHTGLTTVKGARRLAQEIEEHGQSSRAWVSGFSDLGLKTIKDQKTGIKLMRVRTWTGEGPVSRTWVSSTAKQGFDAININLDALRPETVAYAKSLGLTVSAWGWPDAVEKDNQKAIDMDVDMFMTDRLDDLHQRLRR